MGIYFGKAKIQKYFGGMPDIFWGQSVDAWAESRLQGKMRVPPLAPWGVNVLALLPDPWFDPPLNPYLFLFYIASVTKCPGLTKILFYDPYFEKS